MDEKTILLVCEGPTDVYIFEALATHLSISEKRLTIVSLAPHQDATSGTYPSHGYGDVLNWCLANRKKIQMLIDFKGAESLLIQMDTDIAHKANPECVAQNTYSARHCCEEKINQNLGTTQEPPHCHYILPTENTETWILASHNFSAIDKNLKQIANFELITDTEQRLIHQFGYGSKNKKRKLNKEPATKYRDGEKFSKPLVANLSLARQRCSELDRLCYLLEKSLNQFSR
jgi:hypothetical protein